MSTTKSNTAKATVRSLSSLISPRPEVRPLKTPPNLTPAQNRVQATAIEISKDLQELFGSPAADVNSEIEDALQNAMLDAARARPSDRIDIPQDLKDLYKSIDDNTIREVIRMTEVAACSETTKLFAEGMGPANITEQVYRYRQVILYATMLLSERAAEREEQNRKIRGF